MKVVQCCVLSVALLFAGCAVQKRQREPASLGIASIIVLSLTISLAGFTLLSEMSLRKKKKRKWWNSLLVSVDENRTTLVFKSLGPAAARKLDINEEERLDYNEHVSKFNLFLDQLSERIKAREMDLAGIQASGRGYTDLEEDEMENLREFGEELADELEISNLAFSTFRKISTIVMEDIKEKMKNVSQNPSTKER